MSFLSRIVGGCGGGSTTVSNNETATLYRQLGIGINTEDILSERERFLVLSSRDFLRAANFALFASISARRRSARDSAPDEEDDIVKTAVDTHVYTRRMSVLGGVSGQVERFCGDRRRGALTPERFLTRDFEAAWTGRGRWCL